jgi:hypothetical protein
MNSKNLKAGLIAATITAAALLTGQVSMAQGIDSTAKKVGHKTASLAVKGASAVKDKVYKEKVGPAGQTLYIDSKDRKYYVDDKGKKVYVTALQMKDKPKD